MGSFDCTLKNPRWVIALAGAFDEDDALGLEERVRAAIEGGAAAREIVFDLRPLDDFSIYARTVMVRLQVYLSARISPRSVYLADRPRFRGLGLWIAHLADDPRCKAVMTEEHADEWLKSTALREDDAEARTRSRS